MTTDKAREKLTAARAALRAARPATDARGAGYGPALALASHALLLAEGDSMLTAECERLLREVEGRMGAQGILALGAC